MITQRNLSSSLSNSTTSRDCWPTTGWQPLTRRSSSSNNRNSVSMAGAPKSLETERSVKFIECDSEGYFTVQGRMKLAASPSRVYDILSDYNNCDRVYHNIRKSIIEEVKSLDGGAQQLTVTQTCTWRFLTFSGEFLVRLLVEQAREEKTLDFRLIESSFMRAFKGKWLVSPSTHGRDGSPDSCIVDHVLSVRPNLDIPRPFVGLAEGIFVHQVSKLLDDVSAEVERSVVKAV